MFKGTKMKASFVPFCFWVALFVHADDWPQFLGPKANGTSAEKNLIDGFAENGPPLVWEKDVGTGYSAPSVRGGKLVLHHRLKNEEIIEAVGGIDGKPSWRY